MQANEWIYLANQMVQWTQEGHVIPEALLALALACLQKLFVVQIPLPPISQPVSHSKVSLVYRGGGQSREVKLSSRKSYLL